ncbi:MAG: tyrosine-type recombinase/integrase, partial [Paludibacteraceae bacterium]|nr:tyrosine-type recombinase/integrase [Paludibacteraceae bacterium]
GHPNALNKAIHRYQKKLGIPDFKFHALRSYFASYAHSLGIPDADIMAIGGWETDHIMKKVYRKSMEESKKHSMDIITRNLF